MQKPPDSPGPQHRGGRGKHQPNTERSSGFTSVSFRRLKAQGFISRRLLLLGRVARHPGRFWGRKPLRGSLRLQLMRQTPARPAVRGLLGLHAVVVPRHCAPVTHATGPAPAAEETNRPREGEPRAPALATKTGWREHRQTPRPTPQNLSPPARAVPQEEEFHIVGKIDRGGGPSTAGGGLGTGAKREGWGRRKRIHQRRKRG